MLTVVCWKWQPPQNYRSAFGPETVNVLRSMVARNYRRPHRVVCVTDDPAGIDGDIDIVPLWNDHASVPNPHGKGNPSCYRRLKAFAAEAADWFGPRFVSLDLDCVITADMAPLWDRPEPFVIWGDTSPGTPYNGSMWMMTAGARRQVWEQFDPINSPRMSAAMRYFGSDQAWIAACLGPHEARWTRRDGVLSYRMHMLRSSPRFKFGQARNPNLLPSDARVVMFHGRVDPWSPAAQAHGWVRTHYR